MGAFPLSKKHHFLDDAVVSMPYLTLKGLHILAQGNALGCDIEPFSPERAK